MQEKNDIFFCICAKCLVMSDLRSVAINIQCCYYFFALKSFKISKYTKVCNVCLYLYLFWRNTIIHCSTVHIISKSYMKVLINVLWMPDIFFETRDIRFTYRCLLILTQVTFKMIIPKILSAINEWYYSTLVHEINRIEFAEA